jgi:GNAT superfamily N-acetyltransferase
MIHFIDSGDDDNNKEKLELFRAAARLEPVSGARVQTLEKMFGPGARELGLWVQSDNLGRPTAAISRYGGTMTVTGSVIADLEELVEFARTVGGFSHLSAPPALADMLSDLGRIRRFTGMTREAPPFADDFSEVQGAPVLPGVYELLCAIDPAFGAATSKDAWYVHTSHLLRHELGYCAGVYDNRKLVSTGGVYASGETHSVISGLATLDAYRGRGYAGLICRYLSNKIIESGRIPALYTVSESLILFYESMGFVPGKRWAELIREGRE